MLNGQVPPPAVFRSLRVFAVDPGTMIDSDNALVNEKTLQVPWEQLTPGPCGEYVAVVDQDESGAVVSPPVDLDSPWVLAQGGLTPTDGNPQFRQQMLYAVAMNTITSFESALGRAAHWRPVRGHDGSGPVYRRQLALHPHYRNRLEGGYDRHAGLCFGYSLGERRSPLAGTVVFTSLSQDVIAGAVTSALLDGMDLGFDAAQDSGQNSGRDSRRDSGLADAFPDLVALFQHFGDGEVLRAQLGAIRGDFDRRSGLGMVAPQLGLALGRPDGTRNALGYTDAQGQWQAWRPDPSMLHTAGSPADVLVCAVFEGFKRIYAARVADLLRIASSGTGVLPAGRLHPDLVNRLGAEAARTARLVQQMCIRALDYLPPVDVELGDFVRALVTADYDLFPSDEQRYRIAMIEALRSYGIVPQRVTLSPDTLRWSGPPDEQAGAAVGDVVRALSATTTFWNLPADRAELWKARQTWKSELARQLRTSGHPLGPVDVGRRFTIRSFDLRQRSMAAGALTLDWVVKVVQGPEGRRVGVTLLVDAQSGQIRYFVEKPSRDHLVPAETDLLRLALSPVPHLPPRRRLRVFASDPSLGIALETAGINEVTLSLPWERGADGAGLGPGPSGEYVEVVDHDPGSGCYYAPVDLDHPGIVSQNGLTPSESNPQFHQQMVYAVTMRIIDDFERVLGRRVLWSARVTSAAPGAMGSYTGSTEIEQYVPRLRIHPHALREANAYYSPAKKALLFGYFPAPSEPDAGPAPGEGLGPGSPALTVFTCLSHDIVAHEVTHAVLDGIHRHFNEPTNPDVLAFHEAFADLVALLEHFSLPEVLREQIAATRGDLAAQNRLGELAQQFGQAIGRRGALRSAIGSTDPTTGHWSPSEPDPTAYRRVAEPDQRGAILVAAVFDAFLTSYKARVADLLRIATQGTGVLPDGQVHPDLVNRLSAEAATAARRVLDMCIRALDYCPPVDITFGDYLRAVVTAHYETDPVDERHDRVAFVEAFRRYGIVPDDVRSLSPDGLLWRPTSDAPDEDENIVVSLVQSWTADIDSWHLGQDRERLFDLTCANRDALHLYLAEQLGGASRVLGGLDPTKEFEVHSVRPSLGRDWHGRPRLRWVIELIQSQPQYLDPDDSTAAEPDFVFRGGCTLLIDARSGQIRYSIKKRMDPARLDRQRAYLRGTGSQSLAVTYFGPVVSATEPFAMLHRG